MSNEVGLRLKEIRMKLKISQVELGKVLGINGSAVAKYENGVCSLNTRMLNILATKYNVSMDYLVSGRGTLFYGDKESNRIKNIIREDKDLAELFSLVSSISLVRHAVLSYFQRFKLENREIIQEELGKNPDGYVAT